MIAEGTDPRPRATGAPADPVDAGERVAQSAGEALEQLHLAAGGGAAAAIAVRSAATALWQAIAQGDLCIDAARLPPGARASLRTSPIVHCADEAAPTSPRPLVLDGERVYGWRYWRAEAALAQAIAVRAGVGGPAQPGAPTASVGMSHADLRATDGIAADGLDARQREAVALAVTGRLTLLTGGPGTGKTHTLAAIVAEACRRTPGLRVALTAPTGKAAARLAQAIGSNWCAVDQDGAPMPAPEGVTLHRLLRWRPEGAFGRGAEDPVPEDLVIVDECSMIDVLLAAQLLAALRPQARVVLAGDPDQLASVEAGAFFAAACRTTAPTIAARRVALERNFRQREAPEIVAWAQALRDGTLEDGALPPHGLQVMIETERERVLVRARDAYAPCIEQARAMSDTEPQPCAVRTLLDRYDAVRVLAVLRQGPQGADALNLDLARALGGGRTLFAGRLLIVTRNAPALGLANGQVGVMLPAADGWQVWFPHADSARPFPLVQVPAVRDAWVLTVHQSQGSDFDEVLLLPAPAGHPLAVRESLYTGVTRARRRLWLFAQPRDLIDAAARPTRRGSGLEERLLMATGDRDPGRAG